MINDLKIHKFLIFGWLILLVYLTLLFSSPYLLFSIFLSILLVRIFVDSPSWRPFLKYTLYMGAFILLFNILLNENGTTVLFEFYWLRITLESLVFSISMLLRLLIIMAAFAIFNDNLQMGDIIEVLEKLKIPSKSVITLALSFRFFPILLKEARETFEVLMARGISLSSGKMRDRIYARYPVMTAMLETSLERAIQVGEALEIKGYPSSKRRVWKKISLELRHKIVLFFFLLTAIVSTWYIIRFGGFTFFPTIEPLKLNDLYIGILLFILPSSLLLGEVEDDD